MHEIDNIREIGRVCLLLYVVTSTSRIPPSIIYIRIDVYIHSSSLRSDIWVRGTVRSCRAYISHAGTMALLGAPAATSPRAQDGVIGGVLSTSPLGALCYVCKVTNNQADDSVTLSSVIKAASGTLRCRPGIIGALVGEEETPIGIPLVITASGGDSTVDRLGPITNCLQLTGSDRIALRSLVPQLRLVLPLQHLDDDTVVSMCIDVAIMVVLRGSEGSGCGSWSSSDPSFGIVHNAVRCEGGIILACIAKLYSSLRAGAAVPHDGSAERYTATLDFLKSSPIVTLEYAVHVAQQLLLATGTLCVACARAMDVPDSGMLGELLGPPTGRHAADGGGGGGAQQLAESALTLASMFVDLRGGSESRVQSIFGMAGRSGNSNAADGQTPSELQPTCADVSVQLVDVLSRLEGMTLKAISVCWTVVDRWMLGSDPVFAFRSRGESQSKRVAVAGAVAAAAVSGAYMLYSESSVELLGRIASSGCGSDR